MNAQFNYEIAKQRAADLARASAHQRIANEVRAGQSDHGIVKRLAWGRRVAVGATGGRLG